MVSLPVSPSMRSDASSRRTNPSSRSNDWFSSINTTTCWISSFQAIATLLPRLVARSSVASAASASQSPRHLDWKMNDSYHRLDDPPTPPHWIRSARTASTRRTRMSRSPILVLSSLVLVLACAGCGTMPTRQLIADVVPLRESLLTACPAPPSDAVEDRIEAVKARLHQHPVVNFVVYAIRIGVSPHQNRARGIRKLHHLNPHTVNAFRHNIHTPFFPHVLDPDAPTPHHA